MFSLDLSYLPVSTEQLRYLVKFSYKCPDSERALLPVGKFAYFVSPSVFTLSILVNITATSLVFRSGSVNTSNAVPISELLFFFYDHECELYHFIILLLFLMIFGVEIKPSLCGFMIEICA